MVASVGDLNADLTVTCLTMWFFQKTKIVNDPDLAMGEMDGLLVLISCALTSHK